MACLRPPLLLLCLPRTAEQMDLWAAVKVSESLWTLGES